MVTPQPNVGLCNYAAYYVYAVQHWSVYLQSSFRTQEPILTLRRTVLGLCSAGHRLDKVIGQCWLQTARIARKYVSHNYLGSI